MKVHAFTTARPTHSRRNVGAAAFALTRPFALTVFSVACCSAAFVVGDEIETTATNSASRTARADRRAAERLFTLDVLPVLREKCFGCHGSDADDTRGDYDLVTRDSMIRGGESGEAAVVPGDSASSPLYQAVLWDSMEMPPKQSDRLSKSETDAVAAWIDAGAPWPSMTRQREIQTEQWAERRNDDGVILDTSGGTSEEWTYRRYDPADLWAFEPLRPVDPVARPGFQSEHSPGEDAYAADVIDHFIDAAIERGGIRAAATADSRTLIRRAAYDLTGLPPTPAEIDAFTEASGRDLDTAWNALVDRLLSSDHYGERWGQHWLDVVRYADTAGFSNDYERSNAWRYRDYVIRAFNADQPFNEFIIQQLAGDEANPGDTESLIATGLLRMGPWGTAMIPQKEARQLYLDDLVHNVGQAFLSMPMRCCKCHDHKFDPLPTRDYYRMYAAFATTQPAELAAEFLDHENTGGFDDNRRRVQELLDFARGELDKVNAKQEAAARTWYEEHDLPYKHENARKKDPEHAKPPRHVGLTPAEKGIKKVREQDVWIWQRRLERFKPMTQAVYNGQDDWKNARKLRKPTKINLAWRPQTHILQGGALEATGDPVGPGVLSATGLAVTETTPRPRPVPDTRYTPGDHPEPNARAADPFLIHDAVDGRRLALARWIADDRNPLTARSIVNRVWQYHFGRGFVKTANNFGVKGGKPTHPELLDWLTADFIRNGWRIKPLHRKIMRSQAYRRSSHPVDAAKQNAKDPNNDLLASFRPRRLTAEELRDSTLRVSGELNPTIGGLPAMPEINLEVALQPRMIQFSIAPAHQPSRTPAERNRRTIYTYRVRGQADPMLEILNLPNPNESCEMRDAAAVTPQAFTLLNSDAMTDRSIAFARRIRADERRKPDERDAWIDAAIRNAFGRPATTTERDHLGRYLDRMIAYHQDAKPQPVEYPTQVVRSLVEEFTGEPFEFIERLNVYEDYVPDAKPWTVDANTRALADVCLLLFNSNEFLYVY